MRWRTIEENTWCALLGLHAHALTPIHKYIRVHAHTQTHEVVGILPYVNLIFVWMLEVRYLKIFVYPSVSSPRGKWLSINIFSGSIWLFIFDGGLSRDLPCVCTSVFDQFQEGAVVRTRSVIWSSLWLSVLNMKPFDEGLAWALVPDWAGILQWETWEALWHTHQNTVTMF